jgi:hypothetical protein
MASVGDIALEIVRAYARKDYDSVSLWERSARDAAVAGESCICTGFIGERAAEISAKALELAKEIESRCTVERLALPYLWEYRLGQVLKGGF